MEIRNFFIFITIASVSIFLVLQDVEKQFTNNKVFKVYKFIDERISSLFNDSCELKRNYDPFGFSECRMKERKEVLKKQCSQYGLDKPGNDTLHKPNPWEYLVNGKYHIIWCNVFKAASSTWMYNFNILAGYSKRFLNKTRILSVKLARRKYPRVSLEELLMAQNTSLTFLIVRNPFERLLSAYKDKFMFALPKTYHSKLNQEIIKHYRLNKRDPQAPKYATFSEFVRWHLDQIEANNSIDMHLVPATTFCTPCLINIDIIMKFETLQEDQTYFVKKARLPDTLATNWKNKGKGLETSDILSTYYSQLTLEQLEGLYEYYKYDFELFGYDATQYFGCARENN